jgi:hypothetical protein
MNGGIDASLGFSVEFVNVDDGSEESGNIQRDIAFHCLSKGQGVASRKLSALLPGKIIISLYLQPMYPRVYLYV